MIIDMAAFRESGVNMLDIVNCFVDKYIFTHAAAVKILFPIVREQLETAKGERFREILKQL